MKEHPVYACVYVRDFPAQALLRTRPELREAPCVVMAGEPPLEVVCALTDNAYALGLAAGMTKAEVETFRGITVLRRVAAEEESARAALLESSGGFSPRVEDCSEAVTFRCVIDICGTEMLFGPPAALVKTILARMTALGVKASVAASGNFCASLALARGLPAPGELYVARGGEAEALAGLPLSVLSCPEDLSETLELWGVRTLGALAALPERELVSRMGQAGRLLREHARGVATHLFQPVEPPLSLTEQTELDAPVELLDPLLFLVNMMLEQVVLRVASRALALATVTVTFTLDGGKGNHTRIVRPALPTNDRTLWVKLLHLDLEANPPAAAVIALTVEAEPGPTSKVQLGLFAPQMPEASRLDVTLARLRNLVGDGNVGRIVLEDSHRPDGLLVQPFQLPAAKPSDTEPGGQCAMRRLRPPEQLIMTLQAGQPIAFVFREQHYVVRRAYGPWRSSGEWWTGTRWKSEQWDVVARGPDALLYCCMVCDGQRWQMAGLYD